MIKYARPAACFVYFFIAGFETKPAGPWPTTGFKPATATARRGLKTI